MDKVAEMHRACSVRFIQRWNDLPSWDLTIAPIASKYVQGVADLATGNHHWHFESGRYFGSKGKEIYKNRMVTWLPKYIPMAVKS
jgi:hypothetical protein